MEEQCSPLSWGYCYQDEVCMHGSEELKYSFLYTLELESTIVSAKEEIAKREVEVICLKDALNRTFKERDEAQAKCQKLMLENLLLQQQLQKQQQQPQEAAASTEDESKPAADPKKNFSVSISSSADCNNKDINVATSLTSPKPQPPLLLQPQAALSSAAEKPLPEKGRLLKAVMEAGPLLQTLLLAGPLPQWQHPPPKLDSIEIPPVSISSSSPRLSNQASFNSINSCFSNKRGFDQLNEDSDHSSPISKYQKLVALH
ncbi:Enabled-like protein (DUF1635) [Citrus sinensis]|uniref:uncharacterized protein LOC102625644 isoform X1 n=1 Tax=Citrus sinensis TaxID=2711 RepID=UPI0007637DB7|nr:uncharacterized protein LOC102625644 isoform X1 [Citrus sinensis]KAH9704037.1 Enabled-like protein (DUF1635) [Citrus sinensis]